MTVELVSLMLVGLLGATLWIPFVVGINTTDFPGKAESFVRPPSPAGMVPWVHRAHRAHLNLLEQLLPFAIVVLVATQLGVSTPATRIAAASFVALRFVHAVGMITGLARMPVRPLVFTAGWVAIVVIGAEVFRTGP